ncbi:MAG: ISAs1 family transposase [Candidatus Moranbacteria bacterium]|nr:ISAs1 family transposase [Candidatus Moranbacteria bacterium]
MNRKFRFKGSNIYHGCITLSKKTLDLVDNSGNKYVVGVKRNHKKLYENLIDCCQEKSLDKYEEKIRNKGRNEIRITEVFSNKLNKDNLEKWNSAKSLIKVTRLVETKRSKRIEEAYFISNIIPYQRAKMFGKGIRKHWEIESFHYLKDVTFNEDHWKTRQGNAAENYSLIRNVVLNIFRRKNLDQIQATVEKCANNVKFMMSLI